MNALSRIGVTLCAGAVSVLTAFPAFAAPGPVPVTKPGCHAQGGTYTQTGSTRTCTVTSTGAESSTGFFYVADGECSDGPCSCFGVCYTAAYKILRSYTTTTTTTTTRSRTTESTASSSDSFALAPETRECTFGAPFGEPVPLSDCETRGLYDLDVWGSLSDPFFDLMWEPGNPAAWQIV